MENVETLLKTSLSEIEKLLNTKTVVGEPTKIGDTTLIPLLSVGFGFGAGGGVGTAGKKGETGEGTGAGVGGGGGVKPIAMIIIDPNGVRIEPIKGTAATAVESIASAISQAVEKYNKKEEAEPA